MPFDNRFRHQTYTDAEPVTAYEFLTAGEQPPVDSSEFEHRMRDAGDAFRARGIDAIYLAHGSFVGGDAIGLWTTLSRFNPAAADVLARFSKQWIDAALRDRGNYSKSYAELFERSINRDGVRNIPVKLFRWSSENHHIGRADGAIRLLAELCREPRPKRVLLWGHSHAGNVFALLTNLIAGDVECVREFFAASAPFCRRLKSACEEPDAWESMRLQLERESRPLAGNALDIVTFGMPVRYGWETGGYASLLHFVYHKPREGRPPYLAAFPPTVESLMNASGGDFVQQFGIAGTNIAPPVFMWREFQADRRLNQFLQPDLPARDLQKRLKLGMRVPAEGKTILVDYGPCSGNPAVHHAGHAVYTEPKWLLFHCEQVAASFGAANPDEHSPL